MFEEAPDVGDEDFLDWFRDELPDLTDEKLGGLLKTLEQQAAVAAILMLLDITSAAWEGEESDGNVEMAADTNAFSEFSAGKGEDDADAFAYRRYIAQDDACAEICAPLNDVCLPFDDAWWAEHEPPNHPNCECSWEPMTEAEAKEYGIDDAGPDVAVASGFGADKWEPDLSNRPGELADIAQLKMAG